MKKILLALALTAALSSARAQSSVADWRRDLQTIAKELPATHPNAFYRMQRSSWDSAISAIDAKLPTMTRNQAMVALSQLVAMVNDGHTTINPLFDRAMNIHYFPVRFELFEDGLFIRSASPKYASVVGSKVIRVGKLSADSALARIATTIGHENDWWLRGLAPARLALAEIVDGLAITDNPAQLPLVIEKNDKRENVALEIGGVVTPSGHNPLAGIDMAGWTDMRSGNDPLWMKKPELLYWSEFIPGDSTLYVSYRAVVTYDELPNATFWRNTFAMADSLPVKRLVLDIRENTGGNSEYNRQVIRGIIARPKLDKPGSLFVITGSKTFSAAMNLALDLEQWTHAIFVGEPTGNATVFYGDHNQIVLPVSGITVNVSTLPWYPDNPRDRRSFIAPRLYTGMTSAEYRGGVDPAMRAILGVGSTPSVAARVEAAITKGDSATAIRILRGATADPLNRFRSPEADINALGYRLLPSNPGGALAVFRINTMVFPKSANVWDSYGESLASAGRRDEAIAAYKRALELDPGFDSATEALRRLGSR